MNRMLEKLFSGSAGTEVREHSADQIQATLAEYVARAMKVSPDTLDVGEPLENFGLDSRTAVSIAGQLEAWLGREVPPTLLWDHPTIEAVAAYLTSPEPAES